MPDRAEWLETLPLLTESQRHELRSVFRRALIESPMPTALTDLQGTLLGANEQFAQLLGLHEAELAGRPMFQYVHEDDRASIQAAVSRLRHGGEEVIRNEARFVRADGRLVWIRGHAALVDGPAGDGTSYMVGIVQDITSEKYAQQQARTLIEIGTGIAAGDPIEETAGRLAELAMARWMEVGVTLTLADPARRVLTPVQHRLMPTGLYEAFGEIPIAPTGPSCGVAAWSNEPVAMANMFTDPRTVSLRAMLAEFGIAASWSQPLRDPEGHVIGTLGLYHSRPSEPTDEDWQTLSDVAGVAAIAILTHNRRRANREERQRLRTDSRTGLPNELALLDVVDTTVASGDPVSIVVVALRGPAAVRNEKHLRDRTLSTMAERIRQLAGIVAVGVSGLGSLIVVARGEWSTHEVELLQRVLARALILDEMSILPQVSIGAASTDGDLTLSAADLLAQAKGVVPPQQGVAVALPRLGERIEPELTADVSRALQQGEFVVHYQPQVDLTNGELLGSEALVRWQHPTRGLLPPAAFLPAVEAIGAGSELAFAVARMVSAEESRRAEVGLHGPVAINVTATDLINASLMHFLLDGDAQLWKQITIELTESQFADVQAVRALEDLAAHGYSIALDDFGTGYSALSALHALPLSTVKIDRSFIERLPNDPAADALIAAMTALCAQLAITVVAEGVETREQLAALRTLGCVRAQGFLFSEPLPLDEHDISGAHWQQLAKPERRGRGVQPVDDAMGRRIADLAAEGSSPHTIAAVLNRDGRRTATGTKWTARAVSAALIDVS